MSNATLLNTNRLLTQIPKRLASSAAASAQPAAQAPRRSAAVAEPLRVTKLPNGLVVASIENHSPVTRVSAVVNVGARDEAPGQQGAAHALRVYSGLATRNYTVFGLSRNLNQIGAEFNVTSDRESTSYSLECVRSHSARALDVLAEVVSRPEFRHWEIKDANPRLQLDLDYYDEQPELRIGDLIHRAAFRNSLSRSLYAPRFNLSNLNSETLHQFRERVFSQNRLTIVGLGINHDELVRNADKFRLPNVNYTRQAAKYINSEVLEDTESELVHVAVAHEGVSLASKDLLASRVASYALGTGGARIKYSSGASRLERVVVPLAREPAAVSTFNFNYSDAGIFGVHVVGNKSDVAKVVRGAIREVARAAQSGFSNDEINRAKNALKASISFAHESSHNVIAAIAQNPDAAAQSINLNEVFRQIDALSANDVNSFLKRASSSKPSLAAVGDLTELPRLDEITSA